jgi:hypothetical protein
VEIVGSWAFILGPVSCVLLLPLAWVVVNNSASAAQHKSVMTMLAVVGAALLVGHWFAWWFSFDYSAGESSPNDLFGVSTVLMYASALACLSAVAVTGALWLRSRGSTTPTA